jgi:aspartyl/asparaginyl beta-hydroxylase (cupin superfamily)
MPLQHYLLIPGKHIRKHLDRYDHFVRFR